ncbi:hypothetical protein HO173_009585 [Letharia columbiana]|uniref:Multicopper oxidase n=1 Tax=Letharia columbiana TaxID=112416 RepID=A0A8H6L1N2_9LECA|nr:uncharacterized protein HO173_009585 [Letharia columbiana]KAF6232202.1 hypothetical protein HO173_009585 [Letharia columbiana]
MTASVAAAAAVASIAALSALVPALPQTVTNGASVLGTLSAPSLSLTGVDGIVSWGANTVSNYNPYLTDFSSGRQGPTYNFNIARGFISPDGVNRSSILINGAFPGPTIEANWGDTITVNVCNQITGPEEGTSLHWHGLLQKTSPWFDGVPAVEQCPIAPGTCMTYSFLADVYGTSWYHSHYSAQYSAGVAGAMIIHGPCQEQYEYDVGPILLSDWYHQTYEQIVDEVMASPPNPLPPFSDSNLINGKMSLDCAQFPNKAEQCTSNAGLSKFQFHSGKRHRLRLINSGAEGIQRFTIDGHKMRVIANDFVPVEPYTTDMVTLGVGQRTDVIVQGTGPPNSTFWMRSDLSPTCDTASHPYALAAIYYEHADTNSVPNTTATPYDDSKCGNDDLSLTTPYYKFSPTKDPAVTQDLTITAHTNDSNVFLFYVNNQTFRADYNAPILPLAVAGNLSLPDPDWQVHNFGTNASVRLVVYNTFVASHPMHLHGHNFNVLAEGFGTWDGTVTHPRNTQRRDVQLVQGGSPENPAYLVLQYDTDNPGTWPFHCHIAWHVSAGLYINTVEQDVLLKERRLPAVVDKTCRAWNAYTAAHVVDEIDSGEKRRFARDFSLG